MVAGQLRFIGKAGWEITVPFQQKIGYIGDKVLGEDLVPPGYV